MFLFFFQTPNDSIPNNIPTESDSSGVASSLWGLLQSIFDQFKEVFPKLLGAIALLIVGWIIAKIVAGVVKRVLLAVKIDKLTDKLQDIDLVQRSGLEIKASVFLSKTIYYALLLIFIIAVSDTLGMEVVSEQIADVLNYIPKLIAASIVFVGGIIIANFVKNAVQTAFRSLNIPSGKLISGFIFYFLLVTVVITALEQAGMDTGFLTSNIQIILAGLVIAFAVGFGFSSRTLLQNLLASNYTKKKFNIGDIIAVGEDKGEITEIDSTSITILTKDGSQIVIPQQEIINNKIKIFATNE